MKQIFPATISLLAAATIVTLLSPVFDSSVYGVNGHPTEWLSFLPSAPFRHGGLSIILSPFIHLNLQHLFMNLIFMAPISLMIERKENKWFLLGTFFILHFLVLASLMFVPAHGKAFLGMSHTVLGLYMFWGLFNKRPGPIVLALVMLGASLVESQNMMATVAHTSGAAMGFVLWGAGSLWKKFRSHRSH